MLKIIRWLRYFHLNILSTLYLNFRAFSFRDAIKIPVLVFGKCFLEDVHRGCIKLSRVEFDSLRLGGGRYTEIFGRSNLYKSYFRFSGLWYVGKNVTIDQGCIVSVCEGATLDLGNNIHINRKTCIHVKEHITISNNTRVGWNCQILDSNFHYTVLNGTISKMNAPVYIGHNVLLANGVSITKGTVLPNYSVVSSMSLVNRNLSEFGEGCLYGGVPAKKLKSGIRRLLGVEKQIDALFEDGRECVNVEDCSFLNDYQ